MIRRTQCSVMLPNEPGQLARATAAISRAGVNLSGVTSVNLGRSAALKFLGEPTDLLVQELAGEGLKVCQSPVFELELGPGCGELHAMASELARAGVNILSCYGNRVAGTMKLILAVDRPDEAVQALALRGQREKDSSAVAA